jgi:hypothetical protein
MKIFISWSGDLSHQVALALRDWLPHVLNVLEPYVSSKDIKAGEQWFSNVRKELEDSRYGIICLTKDNRNQPWLLFEAGALSASMTRARVVPFLIDVAPSDLNPPLSEFQAVTRRKSDVLHLLLSLHREIDAPQINEVQLEKAFEVWWPQLNESIEKAIADTPSALYPRGSENIKSEVTPSPKEEKERLILEEVLKNTRSLMQLFEDFRFNGADRVLLEAEGAISRQETSRTNDRSSTTSFAPRLSIATFRGIEKSAAEMLKKGNSPDQVVDSLVRSGVPKIDAENFVKEHGNQ